MSAALAEDKSLEDADLSPWSTDPDLPELGTADTCLNEFGVADEPGVFAEVDAEDAMLGKPELAPGAACAGTGPSNPGREPNMPPNGAAVPPRALLPLIPSSTLKPAKLTPAKSLPMSYGLIGAGEPYGEGLAAYVGGAGTPR